MSFAVFRSAAMSDDALPRRRACSALTNLAHNMPAQLLVRLSFFFLFIITSLDISYSD
jgi:hypothetical protein